MLNQPGRWPFWGRDAALLFFVLAPVAGFVAFVFVRREDPVYIWDFLGYWDFYRHYGELIATGSPWIEQAFTSIRNDDYNPIAAILMSPVYAVAGGSREAFVSAIAALYLVPAALVVSVLSTKAGHGGRNAFLLIVLLAVLFVPFWRPTLRGMIDVVALVPLGCAAFVILFMGRVPLLRQLVLRAVAIGLLLWLAFLLRRHFAYTIVVLFGLLTVVEGYRASKERHRLELLAKRVFTLGLSGVIFLATALLLQSDFVLRAATTDYSSLYQAYQEPISTQIKSMILRLGIGFLLLTAVGVFLAIRDRNWAMLGLFGVAVGTFLLFSRTQTMADHHFLAVAFFLFPVIALPVVKLVERGSSASLALAASIPLFGSVSFMMNVILSADPAEASPVLSWVLSEPLPPIRLERMDSYRDLTRRLDEITAQGEQIVMFASSSRASDELFRVLQPSLTTRLHATPHIGEVSLFNFEQLSAEYAIAFDPLPTHMAVGAQEHLVLANQRLLTRTGFGAAFEPTGDGFVLADNVQATILHRWRPVAREEINELYEALVGAFPRWKGRQALATSMYLSKRDVTAGDHYGEFRPYNPNSFSAHPGATTPTVVRFGEDSSGAPARVRIRVRSRGDGCEDTNGVGITIANQAGPGQRLVLAAGEITLLALPESSASIVIMIDNNGDPTCDSTFFEFVNP
jgi:hypothetical protein